MKYLKKFEFYVDETEELTEEEEIKIAEICDEIELYHVTGKCEFSSCDDDNIYLELTWYREGEDIIPPQLITIDRKTMVYKGY